MSAIERIRKADSCRLFPAVLKLGEEEIPVQVRLLSIDEMDAALSLISGRDRKKIVELLAKEFVDPETGENVFSPEDIRQLTRNAFNRVLDLFFSANSGEQEKKADRGGIFASRGGGAPALHGAGTSGANLPAGTGRLAAVSGGTRAKNREDRLLLCAALRSARGVSRG